MRRPSATFAIIVAALLVVAIALPAAAADPGKADGRVQWTALNETHRSSSFWVRDGVPGQDSSRGDRGWYYLRTVRPDGGYVGSMLLKVRCVKVDGDVAHFAGKIRYATGEYHVGSWYVVSVQDSPDQIGMWRQDDRATACGMVWDFSKQRKATVTGGYIRVRDPR